MFKNISNNNNIMKKKINFHFKCCNNFCHSLTIIKDWPFFSLLLSLSAGQQVFAVVAVILYTLWIFLHFLHFVFVAVLIAQQYYRRQWLTNLHLFQEFSLRFYKFGFNERFSCETLNSRLNTFFLNLKNIKPK